MSRHILLSRTLQSHAYDLSRQLHRQLIKSRLRRGLARRPSLTDLVSRHVLPALSVAPALMSQSKRLEREMYRHSLEGMIRKRPRPEEVRFLGVEWEEERVSVKRLARRFSALQVGTRRAVGRESPTRAAVWRLRTFWEKLSLGA
jgi:hypothetical protein